MKMRLKAGVRAAAMGAAVLAAGAFAGVADVAEARDAPDSFADLTDKLAPAVVNISTARNVGQQQPFADGSPFEQFNEFFGRRQLASLGSGFIVDPSGIVVTNNHVIDGADEISIGLDDGRSYEAVVLGRDPDSDLAVLKVNDPAAPDDLPHVRWGDSETARVGDWVIAIGNPFGLGGTVTAGIISARNRDINAGNYDSFIQTDASINRGNSGGPLFDLDGRVIGVNTAIISPTGGSIGIGFAVPSAWARQTVDQIVQFGETRRGWLGVRVDEVTDDLAESLGLAKTGGALVTGVTTESPADKGGLEVGDVVLKFDGAEVKDWRSLPRMVAQAQVGGTVRVEVLREKKKRTLRVTLEQRETSPIASLNRKAQPEPVVPTDGAAILGMTLEPLNAENRRRYGISADVQGVVVTRVDPASNAAGNIAPGDVILEVQWKEVGDPNSAEKQISKVLNDSDAPILLFIKRGDTETFKTVRP